MLNKPIYTMCDERIKNRASMYIMNSKIKGIKDTDSFKGLIEIALNEYMLQHPI
jgi:hypothetical protein